MQKLKVAGDDPFHFLWVHARIAPFPEICAHDQLALERWTFNDVIGAIDAHTGANRKWGLCAVNLEHNIHKIVFSR